MPKVDGVAEAEDGREGFSSGKLEDLGATIGRGIAENMEDVVGDCEAPVGGKYVENPKTRDSGIVCVIPQRGRCPMGCEDCFYQSGRSYLHPIEENTPNMIPPSWAAGLVVRVNDGNDSNVERDLVIKSTECYPMRFFNTSIPDLDFPGPVVLTVNPGKMTDVGFYRLPKPPANLMFVRVRTNAWNSLPTGRDTDIVGRAVDYYTSRGVPTVLTFMAYHSQDSIPKMFRHCYVERKRTLNTYWAITTAAWECAMTPYRRNDWVYSCGKTEGELGTTACRHCGNCLREFFATTERMGNCV